jgi:hypothetical protein
MGISKNIKTPEIFSKHFESYHEEVKDNPRLVQDYVGKDAKLVLRERERPLTMVGFEAWLCVNKIITDVSDYFENKDGRYAEFVPICRAIKSIIRADQIDGGMTNVYNSSITARLNSLTEKIETKTDDVREIKVTVVKNKPKN